MTASTSRDSSLFYFAYGSNMDPDRFRDRVGDWITKRRARLLDHRLRFAASVQSEGGGGAVVDECPGETVDGVIYEIRPEQIQAMDREEFDPSRNKEQKGKRVSATVESEGQPVEVELYTLSDDGKWSAPSDRYLGHILEGLEKAGYAESALEKVRIAAEKARHEES